MQSRRCHVPPCSRTVVWVNMHLVDLVTCWVRDIKTQELISQIFYELIIQNLVKMRFALILFLIFLIRSQFCSCHDSLPDLIHSFHIKTTWIFTRFGLWAYQLFVKGNPGCWQKQWCSYCMMAFTLDWPLTMFLIILRKQKIYWHFLSFLDGQDGVGSWNVSSWKARTYVSYSVIIIAADDLGTHGAGESAAMVLTYFLQNIMVPAPTGSTQNQLHSSLMVHSNLMIIIKGW